MRNANEALCRMPVPPRKPEISVEAAGTIVIVDVTDDMAEIGAGDVRDAKDRTMQAKAVYDLGKTVQSIQNKIGLTGKTVVKEHKGKSYLIIKGYAGKRPLAGTRYLATNPVVANLVMAPKTLAKGALRATKLDIVVTVGTEVAEYLLTDDATMGRLLGQTTAQLLKGAFVGAAGVLAAIGVTALTSVAVVPMVAAFVVTIGLGMTVDAADRKYGLTDALAAKIEATVEEADTRRKSALRKARQSYAAFEQEFVRYMMTLPYR